MIALVSRCRKQYSASTSFADLLQEGNLAFVEAVERFPYQKSARDLLEVFHKFVDVYVTNAIRWYFFKDLPVKMDAHRYLDAYHAGQDEVLHAIKYPYRLDRPKYDEEEDEPFSAFVTPAVVLPSPQEDEKYGQRRAQVEALLALLTPKQREVISLYFGLSEENQETETGNFKAISHHLGLEKSTAFHRWQRALRKLQAAGSVKPSPDLHPSVSCR